ncbi:hypothetical protein E6W39_00205 [Kitasatospora acidiphila]|uniref:Condensation domain-containing protein n=1 Tax=Kitasatospora acidiphila TaxID=2567942 RepID=A0A540WG64_9ACTN|nr:hypothetical protein E6W39_00205 [Kitasatospora acidiphila]
MAPVPRDLTAGRNTAGTARTVERALDAAATTRLLEPHSWADGATTQELLLTAFAAAYGDWSGAPTTALRMLHHGRHGLGTGGDLRSTLGWLSIDYPLVLPTAAAPGQTLLARVRDRLAATPRHGYGYGILRHLAAEPLRRRMRSLPTPEINFNYLGREDVAVPRPGQWRPAEERITDRFSPQEDRGSVLQLRIFVRRGRLVLELQYSESLHRSRTVASLADGFARQLTALLPPR